ncbi:hypothetical protein SteCoe_15079 [Stentor coeruleus]|uniref:Uncharacterized protein n=1 Tax=Stentor coeruleus TaxID=5963 RepID=A0A1R2C4L7_9CILI|nr:hypothetical protein SteCoe_15079 [Stentor coeruleus]
MYKNPDSMKILDNGDEKIITNDPGKIIKALKIEDPDVKGLQKALKDIFTSNLAHKRYLVSLLHSLLVFVPYADNENIVKTIKETWEICEKIMDQMVFSIEKSSSEDIFAMCLEDYRIKIDNWHLIKSFEDLDKTVVRKVKSVGRCGVEYVDGVYMAFEHEKASEIKFFLTKFPCKLNKKGQNVYFFTGYIRILLSEDEVSYYSSQQSYPDEIVLSFEPLPIKNTINFAFIPISVLNTLSNSSGYYENIKILTWDSKSESQAYSSKLLNGFELFLEQQITNLIMQIPSQTFLIYAPTDSQLSTTKTTLQRFLTKFSRLNSRKKLLPKSIDTLIYHSLPSTHLKLSFNLLIQSTPLQEYSSKKYCIKLAFSLFSDLITSI